METPRLYDPARAETRAAFGLAEAEIAAAGIAGATAEQMRAIVAVLAEARLDPAALLDAATTEMLTSSQRVEYAQRAAVADLAAGIGMAEGTVWALARQGEALIGATPRVWARFRAGEISAPNARHLAERVAEVAQERWDELDAAVEQIARLAPARFAARLRRIVDDLASEPLAARLERAEEKRCVTREPERDGMAWLGIRLRDVTAALVMSRLDTEAEHLASLPGETRTRDQLRADIAAALLMSTSAATPAVRPTVSVTVPVMTLLGLSEDPGTLDGCVPIDPDTARELAAGARSFHRILTHPITGAILDFDRTTYRVPADLKRAVITRNPTCVFPGCGRHAQRCDLDHTHAWAEGGTTCVSNLRPLCEHHHRLKHLTTWRVRPSPAGVVWTSPTGRIHHIDDPPPF